MPSMFLQGAIVQNCWSIVLLLTKYKLHRRRAQGSHSATTVRVNPKLVHDVIAQSLDVQVVFFHGVVVGALLDRLSIVPYPYLNG